jgi:hypothetical protein
MAKPGTVTTWSTDTNIATGTEAGTPTKVAPSAGFIAQGLVPGDLFVGPYVNWLINAICGWIAYLNLSGTDEITYSNTRTRTVMVSALGGTSTLTIGDPDVTASDDGAVTFPATTNPVSYRVPLQIPQGATLTQVRAGVAGTGAGLAFKVFRTPVVKTNGSTGTGTIGQLGTTQTATTTGALLTISGLAAVATDADVFCATFISNASGGGQAVSWIELTYTETRATGSC